MLFEILWFRQAGWIVGNTVWASSAVLAAFMAGLALGNAVVLRYGASWRNPLALYAKLEVLLALLGLGLVLLLPQLPQLFAPLWRALADQANILAALRFALLFILLLLPTLIMGLTLALVARALSAVEQGPASSQLGKIVGRLYTMNTAGAVLAALFADQLLVASIGVIASGVVAAVLDIGAAFVVFAYLRRQHEFNQAVCRPSSDAVNAVPLRPIAGALLLAFSTGALLLGLEVLWFRLLLLFGRGTDAAFGLMLAIVLAGLSIGSALVGFNKHRNAIDQKHSSVALCVVPFVLLLSAMAGYFLLQPEWARQLAVTITAEWPAILLTGLVLMLPASICSGWLFAALAGHIRGKLAVTLSEQCIGQGETGALANRAVGWLSISNTAGAALAALLVGLLLLPTLGIEKSLFLLLGAYAVVVALWSGKNWTIAAAIICLIALTPLLGSQRLEQHMDLATRLYRQLDGAQVVWRKEGLNETVQLLERRLLDEPWQHRLITDGYSMTNTAADSQRYMRLFAYLPAALMQNGVDNALLISYGVGSTAQALLNLQPQSLTVVDVSQDIADLSSRIHPSPALDPLAHPNTQLVIEDGRQFLLRSDQQFDLITAEPPPPRLRRIESLYSQEYFQLLAKRLRDGGMASYWLPVDQLERASAAAIFKAFCSAFEHCSLWAGSQYNWIMLGAKASSDLSAKPWQAAMSNPRLNKDLLQRDLGSIAIANPQQLFASFIGDSEQLKGLLPDVAPLTDNFPGRLSKRLHSEADLMFYYRLMDEQETAKRFASSELAAALSPANVNAALAWFPYQPLFNQSLRQDIQTSYKLIESLLWLNRTADSGPLQSQLQTPLLWILGSDQRAAEIVFDAVYQSDWPSRWQHLTKPQVENYWWQQAAMALVSGDTGSATLAYGHYFQLTGESLQSGVVPNSAIRFQAGLAAFCLALQNNKAPASSEELITARRQFLRLRRQYSSLEWPERCKNL